MIDVEKAIRAAVHDLAAEGRPVDLGDRALAAARRRRRRARATAALAVGVVTVGALTWPHWATRADRPAVRGSEPTVADAPATPPSGPGDTPWTALFAGLPRDHTVPPPNAAGRLVVAAYADAATSDAMHLLDPTSGQYRTAEVHSALAFSPGLRYALVARQNSVSGANELGVYDTVAGRMLGRIDVTTWLPPGSDRDAAGGSWSPDGRSIVLAVRRALPGRGWLVDRLIFVDALTGARRAVDIHATGGLEPSGLLGWTAGGVALAADRAGTDEAPRAHLVYDRQGRPTSVHPWPGQGTALPVSGTDQLLVMPLGPGEITVMGLSTGAVLHRYPTGPVSAIPGWEQPLGWRDGTLVYRSQSCTSDGCVDGPRLLGVAADTGQTRTLHTLRDKADHIVVAPGGGLAGAAGRLTW